MKELFDEGYDFCFSEANADPARGRLLLRRSGEGGCKESYYYLGISYELEGLFDEADEAYILAKSEDGRLLILAAYRSAILHKKKKVLQPDKAYYLRAFRQLSKDEHWPSVGHHMRERLKGSYGASEFLIGLFSILPVFCRILRAALRDPDQETIRMRRS